jgi:hypothetical protein
MNHKELQEILPENKKNFQVEYGTEENEFGRVDWFFCIRREDGKFYRNKTRFSDEILRGTSVEIIIRNLESTMEETIRAFLSDTLSEHIDSEQNLNKEVEFNNAGVSNLETPQQKISSQSEKIYNEFQLAGEKND